MAQRAGAGVAGLLIADGGFFAAFAVAAALILAPAYLYYAFFTAMETNERSAKQIEASLVARPGLPRRVGDATTPLGLGRVPPRA